MNPKIKAIAATVNGTEPKYGSASSVYFSVILSDMEVYVRVSDHVHTPRRQGGAGTGSVHVNLPDSIDPSEGVRLIEAAIADRRRVLAKDFAPFRLKVGDVVRHGHHNLKVQAVRPEERLYLVHLPGVGQKWFVDESI